MNNQVLDAAREFYYSAPESTGDALSYGLSFSLFGFATVFAVLAVIMFIVILFGKVFSGASKSKASQKQQKKTEKKVEAKQQPKVEPAPQVSIPAPSDNSAVVAIIMAAVSAFRGANGETGGFRVVSFKKRK